VSSFLGRVGSRAGLAPGVNTHTPLSVRYVSADNENPDLREYALFALRNLLHNNSENQAIVDTFQAEEHVGPTVVVRDLVGAK
jgi:hypothetical protein